MNGTNPGAFFQRRLDLSVSALILLIAALLRLIRLDQGFWTDEIFSMQNYFKASWTTLFTEMSHLNHHPLYSMLAKLMILALGEKECTVRLPAFVFGSLTPPLLYLFGANWLSRRAGAAAALLACLSMWMVWFSQDARGYAPMIFFSLLATHLWLGFAGRRSFRLGLGYLVATVVAVYSHMFGAAVIAGQLLVSLAMAKDRDGRRDWLFCSGLTLMGLMLSALAYAPLLPDFISYVSTVATEIQGRIVTGKFAAQVFFSWSGGLYHPWLSLPILAGAGAGAVLILRREPLIFWLWTASLAIGFAVPLLLGSFSFHRFYSYGMPGFYLFLGAAFDRLWSSKDRTTKAVGVLAFLMVIALMIPQLLSYYRHGKQGFRDAAQWLQNNAPAGTRVIAVSFSAETFPYYHPSAFKVGPGERLYPEELKGAVVVFAHRWSVPEENRKILVKLCGPPRVFRSAGLREYDTYLYICY